MTQQLLFLQDQVSKLESFTGVEDWVPTMAPLKLNEKIQETIAKLPKDIQNKYEKIKKLINNYSKVIDDILPEQKVETVQSEQEEMNEVAQELEDIDLMSKYLNMELLFNLQKHNEDLKLLESSSKIQYVDPKQPLKAIEFSSQQLSKLGEVRREQFEQLALLNSNIIASFNQRIKAIENRISELQRKA